MARHRSPQGRRTHLGLPLSPLAAAAGAGGGALVSPAALAPRVIATVVAGGALAAAGQAALSHTIPLAADGANVLKLSVQELLGTPAASPAVPLVALSPAVAPVAAEPRPVDVGDLVKAAELHHRTARETAARDTAAREATAREAREATAREATAREATAREAAAREAAAREAARDAAARAAAARKAAAPARPQVRVPSTLPAAGAVQMVVGRVTSGFGARWGRAHRGLDIAAPIGTPIRAPLAGEVIASGPASGFGLWVRVRHDDGTVTTYGHVNRALVRVGEHVGAGQQIAEVGNRGQSTGPHLHVEVQTPAGATVNPRPWLDQHAVGY